MINSGAEIAERLDRGTQGRDKDPLVITPLPNLKELRSGGAASIDLRLGAWFAIPRPSRMPYLDIAQSSVGGVEEAPSTKLVYVPFGHEFYLHPRNFVLAVTLEWIRVPRDLAFYVVGRSSLGRRGLIIATATGVHPTFAGCLTLELANLGEIPIAIYPGMSVCQLFAHSVTGSPDIAETSKFIGFRRPVLGQVTLDEFAQRLRGIPGAAAQATDG